jgi:hypothetical protein
MLRLVEPLTLGTLESAVRVSFARDTCAEDDLPSWTPENPSRGHCAVAALTLNDLLGGLLLRAEVHRDGLHTGYHWWNRLAGVDVDLTADQFADDEVVGEPAVIERPPGRPRRYADQYELFQGRVLAALGIEGQSQPG